MKPLIVICYCSVSNNKYITELKSSKVWHSTTKYKREVWQCNKKFENGKKGNKCSTPHLFEREIKEAFIKAFNLLCQKKNSVLNNCKDFITILNNTKELDEKIMVQETEVKVLINIARNLVEENATTALDQEDYKNRYAKIEKKFKEEQDKLDELLKERERKRVQKNSIKLFMKAYKEMPEILKEWSLEVWITIIDHAIVYSDGKMKFIFKSGDEIKV